MARSLERRIARLQAQRLAAAPRMLAWQDTGEPGIDADTVQLASGERFTLDEWRRRYPKVLSRGGTNGCQTPSGVTNFTGRV